MKLLRAACLTWHGGEWAAPSIDAVRPFGNSDVPADMHRVLTGEEWPPDSRAEEAVLEQSYRALFRELGAALQVVLSAGTFEPGIYESPQYRNRWTRSDALARSGDA